MTKRTRWGLWFGMAASAVGALATAQYLRTHEHAQPVSTAQRSPASPETARQLARTATRRSAPGRAPDAPIGSQTSTAAASGPGPVKRAKASEAPKLMDYEHALSLLRAAERQGSGPELDLPEFVADDERDQLLHERALSAQDLGERFEGVAAELADVLKNVRGRSSLPLPANAAEIVERRLAEARAKAEEQHLLAALYRVELGDELD